MDLPRRKVQIFTLTLYHIFKCVSLANFCHFICGNLPTVSHRLKIISLLTPNSCTTLITSAVFSEFQDCLEHITVHYNLKSAIADLRIALCNGKAETISVCCSGFITANKSLGDLFNIEVQGIRRDVFELHHDHTVFLGSGNKDSSVLHRVLENVADEITHNARHFASICRNEQFFRCIYAERETRILYFIVVFSESLVD